MKKYLIITALILLICSQPLSAVELVNSPEDLEKLQENFYEAPSMQVPIPEVIDGSIQEPVNGMPFFKKTRIKMTNYFREREYNNKQKRSTKQTEEKNISQSHDKRFNIHNNKEAETVSKEKGEKLIELQGGVKENVAPNDVQLDADKIEYNNETMDIIATGSPVLFFPPQSITLKADKMVYNFKSNILNAYDNVEVIRDGNTVCGDFFQINMNEEYANLDNVKTKASFMTVTARKSEMNEDKIILYDGKIESKESYVLNLQTQMIGGNHFYRMMVNEEDKSSLSDEIGEVPINIKAKDVIVNAKKNHDVLTLKKAKISYGDYDLFTIPSLTIHTNKNHEYFDGNYPEFGSSGRLGMFAGPGFVLDTPIQNGSTVKLMPIINNKGGIGVGGLLKYRSATNFTDFGYGSSAGIFVLKGKQQLDDKLFMQYGMNSFMNEWFLGPRMSKYNFELIYHDLAVVHSTIGKDLDLGFKQRASIGYMHDSDYNRYDEKFKYSNLGTMRTRYMAEAAQTLYKYEDKEKLKSLNLALVMQGSAALYGTGDTQFIGRIGPRVHSQYKYWMQDVGYFASAFQDGTPLKVYDSYRYGHSSVYIREALRLNKYITVAWSGTVNLTGDAPNGKMFQENSFILAFGPDDLKFSIGYDWVREQTYFSILIAMDTKGSSISYDRMIIKNPDRLAKSNEEPVELKVFDNDGVQVKTAPKKMLYAEVIDIEDPDKEQI